MKRGSRQREKKKVARAKPQATTVTGQAAQTSSTTPAETPPPGHPPRVDSPAEAQEKASGFAGLGLSTTMLAALTKAGYLEPTAVQAAVIPKVQEGMDVMAQAKTGTGKTAAFAIPILEGLRAGRRGGRPQALVLAPTRELAVQVRDEFAKLALGRTVRIVAVYGGKPLRRQTDQLRRGADVVVGTPGRVLDHIGRGTLQLDGVRWAVLDEADRMLDIGFRPDIEKILRCLPEGRQTMLFSATLPPPVVRLARRYMRQPITLDCTPGAITVETIEQFYFTVDPERKFELLLRLLERDKPKQAIIFCRTRRGTEKLGQRLAKKVPGVATIHGDLPQRSRDRAMARFREGKIRYLVATDVVGRGIDVTSISHIINYDIPEFCDDYVHRVGRTGRMGAEGVAYTFVTPEEGNQLTRIEMRINRLLQRDEIPGFQAFSRPQSAEKETKPEPKPIFGRPRRRYRRAL